MTTQERKVMKLALEALYEYVEQHGQTHLAKRAMPELREALSSPNGEAQPAVALEQEPVKLVSYNCKCGRTMNFESMRGVVAPQRTWVELTTDDIASICLNQHPLDGIVSFAKELDAKLKEKNSA
jgi:hypothetical protein